MQVKDKGVAMCTPEEQYLIVQELIEDGEIHPVCSACEVDESDELPF